MTRRTRIEYATTHTMSEARRRLSSTACSLMAGPPWGRNAWVPHSACHRMDGQVLGADLNMCASGRKSRNSRLRANERLTLAAPRHLWGKHEDDSAIVGFAVQCLPRRGNVIGFARKRIQSDRTGHR